MVVKYATTRADYAAFTTFTLSYFRITRWAMWLFGVIGCLVFFAILRRSLNRSLALSLSILVAVAAVYVGGRVGGRIMSRLPTEGQGILGDHTLTIGPEGLAEETAVNRSTFSWKSISDVTEDAKYIYIFIGRAAACQVPKRCFSSVTEAHEFVNEARQHWKVAGA